MSSYLTSLTFALLFTACGAKSSGNSAASTAAAVTPLPTTSTLVAAASTSSVNAGATVTFSVIGGTAPYTWTVQSGGGSLSSSTGASVTYTAGASAGLAFLSVTDSAGATANASVTIVSTSTVPVTSGNVCSGNYSATLGAYPAAFVFVQNGTTLTGSLYYAGFEFPLTGTCTTSGMVFTLTNSGDTFQGAFAANGTGATRAAMGGTYNNVYYGTTQNWTATPQ